MKLIDFGSNWKTYGVVAAGLGLGVADKLGVKVPTLAMWAIKFLGQSELRESIRAKAYESADDIVALIEGVLAQVSVKEPPQVDPNSDVTGVKIPSPPPVSVEQLDPIPPVARHIGPVGRAGG